jgi:hypothetical protein
MIKFHHLKPSQSIQISADKQSERGIWHCAAETANSPASRIVYAVTSQLFSFSFLFQLGSNKKKERRKKHAVRSS